MSIAPTVSPIDGIVKGRAANGSLPDSRIRHKAIAHGDDKSSKVVGRAIQDIDLPKGTSIGAIVRGEQVIIGHDNVVIESDDHVILFLTDKRQVAAVERLFQVGLTFF